MRNARKSEILAVLVAFAGICVVFAVGATAVWLTGEARVFGLVVVPTVIVATLLVVYFDWREKLLRPIRAEAEDQEKAA